MKELPTLGHFTTFDSIIISIYIHYILYHLSQHMIFSMGFPPTLLVRRDQYSSVLTDCSRIIFKVRPHTQYRF